MSSTIPTIPTDSYAMQRALWPESGQHILACYDEKTIVVYQAYSPAIGNAAAASGRFGAGWSRTRMSWIKPNFFWMMYRCGWATKVDQERVLAVRIARTGFDTILGLAVESSYLPDVHGPDRDAWATSGKSADVRMQWDPDHAPDGSKQERRAIQLGLRGDTLRRFASEWTEEIVDITPFVQAQRENVSRDRLAHLVTPEERVYVPVDESLCTRLRLSTLPQSA
mgnify:CR=1 FL=1